MHDAGLVIEAVSENEDLKKRIFGELDRVVKPSGILASNTSSISITRIASYTQRPYQVRLLLAELGFLQVLFIWENTKS
jgi:3-hydroxybutyryl-CoA dehydrogenase